MKLAELAAQLTAIDANLTEASNEILDRIADLEAALANVELPFEAGVALDAIVAKAQALADVVPDVAPEPAPDA